MLSTGFVDTDKDIIYRIRRIFEEGFEMFGIAIFNCALYKEILDREIYLLIGDLKTEAQGTESAQVHIRTERP
jgi:hypothetical protein